MIRNQTEARRVAKLAYPYPGCCLCSLDVGIQLAHLDHDAANNERDNLAWLCHHHHWMFDIGLFSVEAAKIQRDYWQEMRGNRTNAYMKDAGRKAAETRSKKGIGRDPETAARSAPSERRISGCDSRTTQGQSPKPGDRTMSKSNHRSIALIAADLLRLSQELGTADYVARGKKAARARKRNAAARKKVATRRSR